MLWFDEDESELWALIVVESVPGVWAEFLELSDEDWIGIFWVLQVLLIKTKKKKN